MSENGFKGREPAVASARRVRLAAVAPDLGGLLPAEGRLVLEQISVPLVDVGDVAIPMDRLLGRGRAFAAIVVEGLVLHDLAIGGDPGLRILGPGDVILARDGAGPTLLGRSSYRARPSTRLAMLGNEFLAAVRREPRLVVGLQAAASEQLERLATQLLICQMPRVGDRVMAMLWLLADSFGRVTPSGTRLPLSLTHEVLGALVGARRPTVTLALGDLTKRGAVLHQDGGWLLLEPAPRVMRTEPGVLEDPELIDQEPTAWAADRREAEPHGSELEHTIERLHEQQRVNTERVRDRLYKARRSHERSSEVLARAGAPRPPFSRKPPSSG